MIVQPTRLNILVEGQTEETFVRDVLSEHLANHQVYVSVRRVETGRDRKRSRIYRGGMTGYGKARGDIRRWLNEDRTAYLTTMFDLYGLPDDFPNIAAARKLGDAYQKVKLIEEGLETDIQNPRFIAYIQLHEFEGLLFSEIEAIDAVLSSYGGSQLKRLQTIRNQFRTPEEINDNEITAPSKRLLKLYPTYDKVTFGVQISKRIGLSIIRRECPHFREWLSKLEGLNPQTEIQE
ncbi:MAG TPA: DUF4276 family protein [Blastocatellia bacterium]|nr:DUF4276 family protein [Blastocatellia bacterium]